MQSLIELSLRKHNVTVLNAVCAATARLVSAQSMLHGDADCMSSVLSSSGHTRVIVCLLNV